MTDRITQLPAPPEARDDPAHTIEALNDQLQDQAIELDMLREALGVPYEPHQSLLERMLEAARGRAGSGAAPEPPAHRPMTDEEIDAVTGSARDALLDHLYEYGPTSEGVQGFVRMLARAVERHHNIGKEESDD